MSNDVTTSNVTAIPNYYVISHNYDVISHNNKRTLKDCYQDSQPKMPPPKRFEIEKTNTPTNSPVRPRCHSTPILTSEMSAHVQYISEPWVDV